MGNSHLSLRRRTVGRLACGVAIAAALLPIEARAQEQTAPAAASEPATAADADAAEEIVIFGRRSGYEQADVDMGVLGVLDYLETPFSVTTIPAIVIESQNAIILTDVTKNDPAVQGEGAQLYSSISIRGFPLTQEANYRQDGSISVNRSNFPFEVVERLEILRGLSSFLYGFTTPGGIVNIVTKRPNGNGTSLKARALYTAPEGFLAHGDLNVGSDVFGVRVNLAREFGESYVRGLDRDRNVAAVAVRWRPTPELTLDADFTYQHNDERLYVPTIFLDNDAVPVPRPINPRRRLHQKWETNTVETRNYGVMARWDFATDWSIRGGARRSFADRPVNGAIFFVTNEAGDYNRLLFRDDTESFAVNSFDTLVSGKVTTGPLDHQITFGYEGFRNENVFGRFNISFDSGGYNLYRTVDIPEPNLPRSGLGFGYKNFESSQDGIVFGDVIDYGDWLTAIVGGRYVWYDQTSFDPTGAETGSYKTDAFTPSGALVIKPFKNFSTYVSYAQGLEPGDTAPLDAANALDQLPAIRSKQIELGAKVKSANERFTAGLTFFRVSRPSFFIDPATNIFGQFGAQVHKGAEFNFGGEVLPQLHLTGGFTYIDAKLTRAEDPALVGRRPPGVAKLQASIYGEFEVVPGAFLNAGVYRVGDRRYDVFTDRTVQGYTRFDIGARWSGEIAGRRAAVIATLENVADKHYWEGANNNLAVGIPRLFKLGVSTTF